jgi:HD-like signal output (HDOD) protein
MISGEGVDRVQLAAVIEERPAFTTNLLKLANAAYYGRPVRVDSIDAVIEVMGIKGVVDMVLTLELVKAFGLPKGIDIERFWDHAVAVATLSKEIATFNHLDGDTAYTLGLLHDVGLLLMARLAPADFKRLLSQTEPQNTVYESMPRLYGISHLDLSIAVIERWGFDRRLIEPLRIDENTNGHSDREIFRLSLLFRQAHAIAHENKYAFCWDRLPAIAPDARLKTPQQHDFASGIGAALLACCYK